MIIKERKKRNRKIIRGIVFTFVVIVTFIVCAAILSGGLSTVGGGDSEEEVIIDNVKDTASPTQEDEDYVDPGEVPSKDDVVGDEDALDSDKEASEDTQEGTDGLAESDIKKNDSETLEEGNSKKQSMNRVVINEEFGLPEVSIDPNAVD